MAIKIEISLSDIASGLGMSADELSRKMREVNEAAAVEVAPQPVAPPAPRLVTSIPTPVVSREAMPEPADDAPTQPTTPPPTPAGVLYRFTAGNSLSGVCPVCAQYVGMVTDGAGSNGVPVPPLHINCRCFLVPVSAVIFDGQTNLGRDKYNWLETLSIPDLRQVIGHDRTTLVVDGLVTIENLYNNDQLVPISQLILRGGWESLGQAAMRLEMTEDAIKAAVQGGLISGVRRLTGGTILIPARSEVNTA